MLKYQGLNPPTGCACEQRVKGRKLSITLKHSVGSDMWYFGSADEHYQGTQKSNCLTWPQGNLPKDIILK